MTSVSRIALAFLIASAGSASAQSVRDFQLPPNPTPTPTPDVIGPVDGPTRVPPVVIATATPTPDTTATQPALPTPAPQASPTGRAIVQPLPPTPDRVNPGLPRSTVQDAPPSIQASPSPTPTAELPSPGPTPFESAPASDAGPEQSAAIEDLAGESWTGLPWWVLAVLGAMIAALAAAFAWRRKRPAAVPQIEKPVVAATPAAPAAPRTDAVALKPEALRMTRSIMAMTLDYRVTVINKSDRPLNDLVIEGDLGSARKDLPMEQQVAASQTALQVRHEIPRLAPNQSLRLEGQIRLPLGEVSVIPQGRSHLIVPLLKMRATARDIAPIALTHIVGRPGDAGTQRVQPFLFESGPGSTSPLATRALG